MHRRVRAIVTAIGLALAAASPAQSQTLEVIGRIPGPASSVYIHDQHAYVSHGPTVRIVDVADPATPRVLGSISFPQDVRGVRVSGSVAYAGIGFAGVGVFDVSDPNHPRSLGEAETPGQVLSIALAGSSVVVTNRLSGLEIFDISDPRSPVPRASYFAEGYAIDVDAAGSYAYVVDTPGGLSLVDLTQSGEVPATGNSPATETSSAVAVTTIEGTSGSQRTIAGLMSANSLLELFDVSTPSNPISVGSYRDEQRDRPPGFEAAAAVNGLVRVRMQGSDAFITDAYPPFQVEVVDISDPGNPVRVAVHHPPGSPRDIAVAGSRVFVALGPAGRAEPPGVVILELRR